MKYPLGLHPGNVFVVFSILLIIGVIAELIIKDYICPTNMFGDLALSTALSGMIASLVVERLGLHLIAEESHSS